MNESHTIIYSLIILISSFIILISVILQKKLFNSLDFVHEKNIKQIKIFLNSHRILMIIFFITYIAVSIAYFKNSIEIQQLLVVILFFLGSCFVLLSVLLSIKIFNEIQKTIFGLLPICMHCKRIYDEEIETTDDNKWTEIEHYVSNKVNARFSHSLCPDCLQTIYPDYAKKVLKNLSKNEK